MSDASWTNLHKDYAQRDWANKPSIFADQVLAFFPKTGSLLELGAGLGQDGLYFASKGYKVTSTDLKTEALRSRIREVQRHTPLTITVGQVDLRALPLAYKDESFNIIYAHLSLHYFDTPTTEAIFTEIYRILKPGGILAFFTNSTDDPEFNTGTKLEDHYFEIDGVKKRYLNVAEATHLAHQFTVLLADDQGETYKDAEKGIHNLIRFIGRK